jgi:hypothetical protein
LSDSYEATHVQLQSFKDEKKHNENYKLVIDSDAQTLSEVFKTTLVHWTKILVSYETRRLIMTDNGGNDQISYTIFTMQISYQFHHERGNSYP